MDQVQIVTPESLWSEEHDCVPLKKRLKILLASKIFSHSGVSEKEPANSGPPIDIFIKKEDGQNNSQEFHSAGSSQGGSSRAPLELSYQDDSPCPDVSAVAINSERRGEFLDDLDHIVLKERQRMLLSRELSGSTKLDSKNARMAKEKSDLGGKKSSREGNEISEISARNGSLMIKEALGSGASTNVGLGISSIISFSPALERQCQGNISTLSGEIDNVNGKVTLCCFSKHFPENNSFVETNLLSSNSKAALPSLAKIKDEPLDNNELQIPNRNAVGNPFSHNPVSVKSELDSAEPCDDIIDHMLLGERMKLMAQRDAPNSSVYKNVGSTREVFPSPLGFKPVLSEPSKPLRVKRPWKRKKTVTDSVQTALEEDAPGLLQVLVEKGVLVDEIKLYGESNGDDALDESLIEESFSELEDVILKLFTQSQSLLKLAPIKCPRGERASYCVACLISLVEQARYLRFRKWPVEWGWCRDLQSFIFVFERHNRIVLERPEYGYATYFFELVDSLPVHWQIKRLVTTMKLSSCSRITLIENRALVVGNDLTEGEARVLMDYGWIPNSGLGTMLNYRDRVVHDRKNETDGSEWRSKIGKLLMDGYNGGSLILNDIPKKLMDYGDANGSQIKLEQESS